MSRSSFAGCSMPAPGTPHGAARFVFPLWRARAHHFSGRKKRIMRRNGLPWRRNFEIASARSFIACGESSIGAVSADLLRQTANARLSSARARSAASRRWRNASISAWRRSTPTPANSTEAADGGDGVGSSIMTRHTPSFAHPASDAVADMREKRRQTPSDDGSGPVHWAPAKRKNP